MHGTCLHDPSCDLVEIWEELLLSVNCKLPYIYSFANVRIWMWACSPTPNKTKTMNWMKNKDKLVNSTYISVEWEQKRTCWVYMLTVEVSTQRSKSTLVFWEKYN